MAGIQSIGLGSDGKLSMDIIDKLKAVDLSNTINPMDTSLTNIDNKQEGLTEILSLLNTFKTSAKNLSDESTFLNRSGYVSGDGVAVTLEKGTDVQTISIGVDNLAQEDVVQSNVFSSRTENISSGEGTFEIEVNGNSSTFDITEDTTLEDLMQMINDDESLDVTAKILNTGTDQFRLVITGNQTGSQNVINITESENLTTGISTEENRVQVASDSSFRYNGISITRPSNKVDDLIYGVNLELTQVTENDITIDVSEDLDSILGEVQSFVEGYNALISFLDESTDYDEVTSESGVFQGNNDIRSIKREINKILLTRDENNTSLIDFGISLTEAGTLSFESTTFVEKYNSDSASAQTFFRGYNEESRGVITHKGGVFYEMNLSLERMSGTNGSLINLQNNLVTQEDRLNKERERALEVIESRYDRMTTQFAQQDAIISAINQQMESLQMQIDAQNNNN
jgi:flagellar hook-associated protein 2